MPVCWSCLPCDTEEVSDMELAQPSGRRVEEGEGSRTRAARKWTRKALEGCGGMKGRLLHRAQVMPTNWILLYLIFTPLLVDKLHPVLSLACAATMLGEASRSDDELLHSQGGPSREEGGVTEERETGQEEEEEEARSGGIKGRLSHALVTSTEFVSRHPVQAMAVVGAVAFPMAAPLVVQGLGFTSAGITAGSWAAGFMSSYGGVVGSSSACAALQGIGAAGLGAKGAAVVAAVGATTSAGIGRLFGRGGAAGEDENTQREGA
eukprot:c23886_g4_i2 orf=304-1095(+)